MLSARTRRVWLVSMDTGSGSGAGDDAPRDAAAVRDGAAAAPAVADGKTEEEVAADTAAAELARFQEAYGALDVSMSGPVEGVPDAVAQLTEAVERALRGELPEPCLTLLVKTILPQSLEGVLKRQLSQVRCLWWWVRGDRVVGADTEGVPATIRRTPPPPGRPVPHC